MQESKDSVSSSWAVFNASKGGSVQHPDVSGLLPMWRDSSKSPAMIKHAIDIVSKAIQHLNPGQTPVVTFDQPLYAIAKAIQWSVPTQYGIENLVLMLGPLHTEMAYMSTLGDFLANSGWTTLIYNAGIAC